MLKTKKQELIIFLTIAGVASFFRLYNIDRSIIFSATAGILTVIGLYLLTKELFEWRIAAIASYLTAISFWHVSFSRSGSASTMVPFILVFAFYFLWKGLKHNHLPDFVMAGIFGGLGFYANIQYYCTASLIAIILFVNYWWYLKKDFDHAKYEYAKIKLLQGFVLLALTTFVIASPVIINFWQHGEFFSPIKISTLSVVKTLGMFNFSNSPLLPWPIGVFFVVGFINELIHWLKRKHGHFSTIHTFMFMWFFVMLIPGFLSTSTPNALLIIGTLPVVMIFTARGIWWFFDKLNSWYSLHDPHSEHEAHAVTALVMIVFLFSIGFMEYWKYFK